VAPPRLDPSHDPERRSWVESANSPTSDFPLQNLPLGLGRNPSGEPSALVAIGEEVLDLGLAAEAGLLDSVAIDLGAGEARLNRLLSSPPEELTALRRAIQKLLEAGSAAEQTIRRGPGLLRPQATAEMLTPTRIGSFSDFFAGIHHAWAASAALEPGAEPGPNYKWVPIAYHSRANTVFPSGTDVRRPTGQLPSDGGVPRFAPCTMLDYELELGLFVGTGSDPGHPVPIDRAADHIAGLCLLNDWSARDIQSWEMAPLGPFLSKNFATTISPWIITRDALLPFQTAVMARGAADPPPLPYLYDERDQAAGGLDIELEVFLRTERMAAEGVEPERLARSNARHLYWTPAQMIAHHTSNGCHLESGDLLGTGTISGPDQTARGSLLEFGRRRSAAVRARQRRDPRLRRRRRRDHLQGSVHRRRFRADRVRRVPRHGAPRDLIRERTSVSRPAPARPQARRPRRDRPARPAARATRAAR
jgi:fumarylacetoacetase